MITAKLRESGHTNSLVRKTTAGLALLMALVLPALPIADGVMATADSSSAYTTLSSFSGHPGVDLAVSGGNYGSDEAIEVTATENNTLVASDQTTANQYGEYATDIQLPTKLAQGNVSIVASGETSGLVSSNGYYVAPFSPTLTTSAGDSVPYSPLTVSGAGYAPNEVVAINFAGATTQTTADSDGNFTDVTVVTPKAVAGSYQLIGVGQSSGAQAIAYQYIDGFYPSASPSSYYVLPATTLAFNGGGFAPNETVTVSDATTGQQYSSFVTDAKGNYSNAGSFIVPSSAAGKNLTFVLAGKLSAASTTTSTVVGQYYPAVSPSTYYVMPGGTVSLSGSGFVPGETVDVTAGTTLLTTVQANAKGVVTTPDINVPVTLAGTSPTYTLTGETSHGSGSVTIQVGNFNPQASPSTYYAMPGSNLSFSGSGYAPDEVVAVFNGTQQVNSFTADATGDFTTGGTVNIAYAAAGSSQTYKLVGVTSNAPISFTIGVSQLMTQLSPSSYYVLPYQNFSVTATGFVPGETLNLTTGNTQLATAVANAKGVATFTTVNLPASSTGSASLVATGVTSGATATASIGIGAYYPSVSLSNYYDKPGDIISANGSGFAPNEAVTLTVGSLTQNLQADALGNVTATFSVPFTHNSNTNTLSVTMAGSLSLSTVSTNLTLAPFTPEVNPSTYYAQPGTPVSFSGSGFLANEPVTVSLNGTVIDTLTANAKGAIASSAYTLPYGTTALYSFSGSTSGATDSISIGLASFYAGVQLSSYYGDGGSQVTLSGSGFAPNEQVTLSSGTTALGSALADSKGAFSKVITIPYAPASTVPVTATGGLSQATATTSFTVAQAYNSVGLGSYAVPAGKAIQITGSGFFANEPVTVTADRISGTYSFTAAADGTLNDSGYVIPTSTSEGMLTLTITGTESFTTHTITLYVQSPNAQ